MRTEQFINGLQAIKWTIEERGLAGVSDLEGIPWSMPMDKFFEAWVETVVRIVAQRTGAQMKTGRKRETTYPIVWEPSYLGSQKSLAPDIWLEWDSVTLIVDAKYKRHWEELQEHSWSKVEQDIREQHRNDLLQALAYANLARTGTVIVCLTYPCSAENWNSLHERGRLIHRAELAVSTRNLHIWLTAVPMATPVDRIAIPLVDNVRKVIVGAANTQ
ncbi:MAG: hypothetical protein JO270_26175 [Acidobacteriaceae bacterium]|nr:hypothetical protein [Acidobacteriaceae bacterium]